MYKKEYISVKRKITESQLVKIVVSDYIEKIIFEELNHEKLYIELTEKLKKYLNFNVDLEFLSDDSEYLQFRTTIYTEDSNTITLDFSVQNNSI